MATRSSARIGIVLIFAGVALYVGSRYWLETRTLVALDTPVSLSRGHIRSQEFDINLNSGYYVSIEVEKSPALNNLECLMRGCYETPAILKAQWALSKAGRVELSGSSDGTNGESPRWGTVGRDVGYFRCSGGRYRLDVDVLSDTSILNAGNPRLRVVADGEGYNHLNRLYDELSLIPGMLVVIGGTLLLLSRTARSVEQPTVIEVSAAPGIGHLTTRSLRRFPRRAVFSGLPSFALIATFLVSLVLIPLWLLTYWTNSTGPSKGIWVFTSSRGVKTQRNDTWVKPLVVRINRENRWFLEDKPVSTEEFPGVLKEALSRRSNWVVCLDADPELPFDVPARALDLIHGSYAKTILVTPNTKKDCYAAAGNR